MRDLPHETGRSAGVEVFPRGSFESLLVKEIERSRRYYRSFGLMEVRLDRGAKGGRPAREPHKTGGATLPSAWPEAVSRIVRRADMVALGPAGELYILLPETPASGMPEISRRVEAALTQPDAFVAGRPGAFAAEPAPAVSQASFPRDGGTSAEMLGALREEG